MVFFREYVNFPGGTNPASPVTLHPESPADELSEIQAQVLRRFTNDMKEQRYWRHQRSPFGAKITIKEYNGIYRGMPRIDKVGKNGPTMRNTVY